MPNSVGLTIVFDCFLDNQKSEALLKQFQSIFASKDFLYFRRQKEAFSFLFKDDSVIRTATEFRECIANQTVNIKRRFNIAFFVNISDMNEAFVHNMQQFGLEIRALIGGIHTEVSLYYHICKDLQDGNPEYLRNYDAFLKLKNETDRSGSVFLLDSLWYEKSGNKSWLSAVVRLMHILSVSDDGYVLRQYGDANATDYSTLLQELREMSSQMLFANCFMTRLDDEDVEEKQARVRALENALNEVRPEFPSDVLKKNYAKICKTAKDRCLARFSISAREFPIPADTFGCFLKRKKNEANLAELNRTLQETIRLHVEEVVLKNFSAEEEREYVAELKEGIPEECWEDISGNLKRLLNADSLDWAEITNRFSYETALIYCANEKQLRGQITKQIEGAKYSDSLEIAIRAIVDTFLQKQAKKLVGKRLTEGERRQKQEELNALLPIMNREQYFKSITDSHTGFHASQYAINAANWSGGKTFLLISTRIADEWEGKIPTVLAKSSVKVYNYDNGLGDDEFQAITVRYWGMDRYSIYKSNIFRLPSNVEIEIGE